MSKWKKGQTEFMINLNYDTRRGCIAIIPKPILEALDKPVRIIFAIKKNNKILVNGQK